MITLNFTAEFIGRFKKLTPELKEVAYKKVDAFKNRANHHQLKVHKLHGKYAGFFGFSVDRKNRIMFEWISDTEARLHTIGDHSIYD